METFHKWHMKLEIFKRSKSKKMKQKHLCQYLKLASEVSKVALIWSDDLTRALLGLVTRVPVMLVLILRT